MNSEKNKIGVLQREKKKEREREGRKEVWLGYGNGGMGGILMGGEVGNDDGIMAS